MSNRRKNSQGAGQVPAPRGGPEQANLELLTELRAELREARGALGDLVRERKAVEQLARDRADAVLETHVNACLAELCRHVDVQLKYIRDQTQAFCRNMVTEISYGRRAPDVPTYLELISALDVLNRAKEGELIADDGDEGADRG